MNSDEFRRIGHRLIDWIADYRAGIAARPVMARTAPGEVKAQLPASPPEHAEGFKAVFRDLERIILPGLTHWQHPQFFGYFPANACLASVLGDYLSTGLGVLGLSWQASPALTELEEVVVDWVRQMVGLSEAWGGVIQDTASTSTLVALLCARERSTGYGLSRGGLQAEERPLVVYASEQSHSSVEKAALLAGFGRNNVRRVAHDAAYALRPDALEEAIGTDLADPVFSMQDRDEWIGWDQATKASRLYHVMDAYILGAVPPYSMLLCGKLIALLVLSNQVRDVFRRRYANHPTLIGKIERPPYLALVTTTSAFGRSSIYNRIRLGGHTYWHPVGYTQGSGEFHFSNGVYADMRAYVEENCRPTAKRATWGKGFRNKREVVRKCLSSLGLSERLLYHGIRREIYAAPLGRRALAFLQGRAKSPSFFDFTVDRLFELFADRWLYPRSERFPDYRQYDPHSYLLWDGT